MNYFTALSYIILFNLLSASLCDCDIDSSILINVTSYILIVSFENSLVGSRCAIKDGSPSDTVVVSFIIYNHYHANHTQGLSSRTNVPFP